MSNPLDGAFQRIFRAQNYIRECDGLMRHFASVSEDVIIANYNTSTPIEFPDIPSDLPLAVSDAIHNIRAALDYLVYELALKDSGAIQEGTQFPFEHCRTGKSPGGNPIGFEAVKDRFLRGVNATHRAMIEKLQPYNGHDWAKNLRDISNPDKHRRLTPFHVRDTMNVWIHGPHADGKKLPTGETVRVDPTHTVFIELGDRKLWVMQTLHGIHGAVSGTLAAFQVEF
jgi:hypothetical protein